MTDMLTHYADLMALANRVRHKEVDRTMYDVGSATNASCGDECAVWVRVEAGNVVDVESEATGCVVSRAAATVIKERARGSIAEVRALTGNDVRTWLGVPVTPLRERCLTTALTALHNALQSYET